jgi:hypothetical protein
MLYKDIAKENLGESFENIKEMTDHMYQRALSIFGTREEQENGVSEKLEASVNEMVFY